MITLLRRMTAVALPVLLVVALGADTVEASGFKAARYRVRHGGSVAHDFYKDHETFKTFGVKHAEALDPNLGWFVGKRIPVGSKVEIRVRKEHRILLVTAIDFQGHRYFCSVTAGSGKIVSRIGQNFRDVHTIHACLGG